VNNGIRLNVRRVRRGNGADSVLLGVPVHRDQPTGDVAAGKGLRVRNDRGEFIDAVTTEGAGGIPLETLRMLYQ
jgi:hypothetical protein